MSLHPPAPWVKLPSSRGVPYFHNRLNGMSVWDIRDVYKLKGMPVPAEVQRALAPDAPAGQHVAAPRGKPGALPMASSEEQPAAGLPAMPAAAASVASGSQAKTAAASIASSEPAASAAQIDIAALLEDEYGHV